MFFFETPVEICFESIQTHIYNSVQKSNPRDQRPLWDTWNIDRHKHRNLQNVTAGKDFLNRIPFSQNSRPTTSKQDVIGNNQLSEEETQEILLMLNKYFTYGVKSTNHIKVCDMAFSFYKSKLSGNIYW